LSVRGAGLGKSQEGCVTKGDDRQGLGRHGEELSAHFLASKGYGILARNWRCEAGELDLVARDGDCLVLVEVRARRGRALGSPEESITPAKQVRLANLAEAYVQTHDWNGDYRIDVVAIEYDRRGRLLRVDHYENAVSG
jgi:putative endonuclease